jgi:hypothetical protein
MASAAGVFVTAACASREDTPPELASTIRLSPKGAERPLPSRWLGYNTPANYDIPVEDPAFRGAVKKLAPHYLRFPGGTVANYYQPESGQLDFGNEPDGSIYRKYLQDQAGPASRRLHPNGVTIEQYIDFAREIDSELIIVPNIETSSTTSQTAWFKRMNAHGFTPREIELGNEFYLALLMDPATVRIFPDWASTVRRQKEYLDAVAPYAAKDARVAVQAASSNFRIPYTTQEQARHRREAKWDADMAPQPWFQAVTHHLYPTIEGSAGPGSVAGLPGNVDRVYPAFMARTDDGFDRSINFVVSKMPGKEIWIPEWGAFEPSSTLGGAVVNFDGMWLHMIARALFAQLRHKEVTISTPHALFANGNLMSTFRRSGAPTGGRPAELGGAGGASGAYVPINFSGVVAWFAEAMRGPDAHYTRLKADGSKRIAAETTMPGEGFRDVEAGLFRVGKAHTLMVQNAWSRPASVDISNVVGRGGGIRADVIETPDLLASLQRSAPTPRELTADTRLIAPPYSLVRIRWTA